jgi:hypothetical protein
METHATSHEQQRWSITRAPGLFLLTWVTRTCPSFVITILALSRTTDSGFLICWICRLNSSGQGISGPLWDPKVQCRLNTNPATGCVLSQMNPVHIFPCYFLKIHFNIILPAPRNTKVFQLVSSLHFLWIQFCKHFSADMRATCLAHLTLHELIFLSMESSPASCHFISPTSRCSPQRPVLKGAGVRQSVVCPTTDWTTGRSRFDPR